jgi:hypothetical protein
MALQKIWTPMRGERSVPEQGFLNLADSHPGAPSGWTSGATLIDPVPISPPLMQTWTLLAWGFTCVGAISGISAGYGKLGSLWAGLLTEGEAPTVSPTNPALPFVSPMLAMPPDITTFEKVWDGANDPVFPADAIPVQAGGTRAVSQNLPQPIPITSGRPLAFGLWLTPSLSNSAVPVIYNAAFSLVYDDGIEPQGAL